jgi:hypothetical protein
MPLNGYVRNDPRVDDLFTRIASDPGGERSNVNAGLQRSELYYRAPHAAPAKFKSRKTFGKRHRAHARRAKQ